MHRLPIAQTKPERAEDDENDVDQSDRVPDD